MAAKKFLRLIGGKMSQAIGVVVSTGAPNDGDIPALDTTGKLDLSLMPVGVGPDTKDLIASEALDPGDYINIWNDGGTEKVRKADNSNGRDAHGFVLTAFSSGATAKAYFEGANDSLAGIVPGTRYYLAAAGGVTTTAPSAPAANIHQFIGIGVDVNTINTDIDDCIGLV